VAVGFLGTTNDYHHMSRYIIQGGVPLKGEVRISGSKNAALPIIAATLLTKETCVLHDVPDISDVRIMLAIAEDLGSEVLFDNNTVTITSKEVTTTEISKDRAKQLRTSLMFLAPLLHRKGEAKIPFPGGCAIGKRPIDSHLTALEKLGATVHQADELVHLSVEELKGALLRIIALSVTGTETAIIAAAVSKGTTEIRLAAAEPHVQDVCRVVEKMGAKVEGIGTNVLTITGTDNPTGFTHTITPDYIEAGTFIIASLVTKGELTLKNVDPTHLDILWDYFDQMNIKYNIDGDTVHMPVPDKIIGPTKAVKSNVYPDFPTDLLAPMAVLLTQAEGINRVFETVYESRLNYIIELEKMGVKAEILNAHEAIIVGPAKLRGNTVTSWDLRAGTAMVLAGLAAEGVTEVTEVKYIDRGYEKYEHKLTSLGANIERVTM